MTEHEIWKRKFFARRATENAVLISALVVLVVVGIWTMWALL